MNLKTANRFNIVSLTDWHVPFEDGKAINAVFKFCKKIQPEIIIVHEIHDFYSLSRFDKDPSRINNLQDELDRANEYLAILRGICPKSRIILLNSNHLDRLRKYLWRQAVELSSLRSLKLSNLLELEKNNIEYGGDMFIYKKFLFKHGDIVRKFSSYTAKAEFDKEGMSGCSGHSHRLGKLYTTKRGGKYVWVESGCLCDLKPEYIMGVADWQHGFSLISFKGNSFYATPIPILADYDIPFWMD